jgi:hypothetical protein
MGRNNMEQAGARETAQIAHRTDTAEAEDVRVFGLQQTSRSHAAEKDTGMSDLMALLKQLFDECGGFARALAPDDLIAGSDHRREIECVECDFLWHEIMACSW